MIKYLKFNFNRKVISESQNKCVVEIAPLNRGMSLTLGNALRRILLSHIPGTAMYAVQIENMIHEFATLPYVSESGVNIILNLRKIIFSADRDIYSQDETITVILKNTNKGVITAKDLILPTGVEIINPDAYIATISKNNALQLKILLRISFGYFTFNDNKKNVEHGIIATDSDYSPVKLATFRVSDYQVSKNASGESLHLEVETNGSISPKAAIGHAAMILSKYSNCFAEWSETLDAEENIFEEATQMQKEIILSKSIENLDLTVRCYNTLKRAGIEKISELVNLDEAAILSLKNMGQKSFEEIKEKLKLLNLSFASSTSTVDAEDVIDEATTQ